MADSSAVTGVAGGVARHSGVASRARISVCGGGLLILDEPACHLPPEALQALSAVMGAEPGRGVLLVAHRREEVALAGRERKLGAGCALLGEQAWRNELRAGGPHVP